MRYIRHPHCVVLLGTFTFHDRLTLMIFPAARCNLSHLMKETSRELVSDFNLSLKLGGTVRNQPKLESLNHHLPVFPFLESINILRRCFVCLSQGLACLHASNIRHNDTKPGNILVDKSGSVLLADFGTQGNFQILRMARAAQNFFQSPHGVQPQPRKPKTKGPQNEHHSPM